MVQSWWNCEDSVWDKVGGYLRLGVGDGSGIVKKVCWTELVGM